MSQTPPERPEDDQPDTRPEGEQPPSWPATPPPQPEYPYAPQATDRPEAPQPPPSPWGAPGGDQGQQPQPQQPQPQQPGYTPPPTAYGTGGYPPAGPPQVPPGGYGYTGGPGYGYGGYAPAAPPAPTPTSTIVLLVISALLTLSCYFTLAGVAPLVMSIVALTRYRTDMESTRRLTRLGWIILGSLSALIAIGLVVFFGFLIASSSSY